MAQCKCTPLPTKKDTYKLLVVSEPGFLVRVELCPDFNFRQYYPRERKDISKLPRHCPLTDLKNQPQEIFPPRKQVLTWSSATALLSRLRHKNRVRHEVGSHDRLKNPVKQVSQMIRHEKKWNKKY
jgi:hypothetical protein